MKLKFIFIWMSRVATPNSVIPGKHPTMTGSPIPLSTEISSRSRRSPDCQQVQKARLGHLEQDVEIQSEAAAVIAEEIAKQWVVGIGADGQGVEVVRQVESAHRNPRCVLGGDREILGQSRVQRKIGGKAGSV